MKFIYRAGADAIFLLHFILVLLAISGWAFPSIWWFYMGALVATLLSDLVFGYCILSKWEFDLRKKYDPKTNYNYTWTTFYTYKITNHQIRDSFYKKVAITAIVLMLLINLYFRFLY
jgi:hypothetical protein